MQNVQSLRVGIVLHREQAHIALDADMFLTAAFHAEEAAEGQDALDKILDICNSDV